MTRVNLGVTTARVGRLGRDEQIDLARVERKRTNLWLVAGLFILVASTAAGLALGATDEQLLPDNPSLRWALAALGVAFLLYVVEQERLLRRLTRALVDAEVLAASLQARIRDLSTLSRVGRLVNSVLTMDEVLAHLIEAVAELTGAQRASVLFREHDQLVVAHSTGPAKAPVGTTLPLDAGVAGWVVRHVEPVLITGRLSRGQFPGHHPRSDDPGSSVIAPLVVDDGEVIGVLTVERSADTEPFTEVELRSVALFAEQAATAVLNARRYEEQRSTVTRLADALERRGEFVATLVHELKSPLTAILGLSHLLVTRTDELAEDRRRRMVVTVREQAQRLAEMVQEVLQVASADAGADLRRDRVALDEVLHQAIEATRAFASARGDAVRPITLELPDAVPAIYGDAEALRRVATNLLENAVKYSPAGAPINVTVAAQHGAVEVRFQDHGQGIPQDELESIFERFRRTPDASSGGVGLGLYIVRSLVSAHGGTVVATSDPGHGAMFTVTLPLRRTEAPGTATTPAAAEVPVGLRAN